MITNKLFFCCLCVFCLFHNKKYTTIFLILFSIIVDPKPEESPKLPPEKLFEFPRPYLNKELPIRVTAVIDPYNILAYVKTKESEAFMDQLDKTCQVGFFHEDYFRHWVENPDYNKLDYLNS